MAPLALSRMAGILLARVPLFALLLFDATRRIFANWLGALFRAGALRGA